MWLQPLAEEGVSTTPHQQGLVPRGGHCLLPSQGLTVQPAPAPRAQWPSSENTLGQEQGEEGGKPRWHSRQRAARGHRVPSVTFCLDDNVQRSITDVPSTS